MKAILLFFVVMAANPILGYAQNDDMYFVPTKNKEKVTKQETISNVEKTETQQNQRSSGNTVVLEERDVDEYNRRYLWKENEEYAGEGETGDAVAEGEEYADESSESDSDFEYTKRILRFCTPSVGVPVSSPLYWELCYGPNSIYWDVYDDGCYAYVFPSSWNYLYYTPYYSSFYWGGYPYYPWRYWGYSWYYPSWSWYSWHPWYNGWHHNHWHKPGWTTRPVTRPSVYWREGSTLNRTNTTNSVRRGSTLTNRGSNYSGTRVTPSRNTSIMRPVRNNTTRVPETTTSRPNTSTGMPRRSESINRSSTISSPVRRNSTISTPARSVNSSGGRSVPMRSNRR